MKWPVHAAEPVLVVVTLALGLTRVQAAPECLVPTGPYQPTQVPYTYVLDRRSPFSDAFVERYRDGMPYLVEAGQLTPGHPYFGPLCDPGALRRGVPEPSLEEFLRRYRENRAKAPDAVAAVRAGGAGQVLTYICMMTTGGDPVKRTGFWRFYDHWDAFAEFHVPPKPDSDPEDWQQRRADGTPVIAYSRDHPPYKPMFRWTNCINHPGWRAYQRWVTEEAARVGVDGFFVDNANTMHCYCRHCQALFAKRLRERYTPAELTDLFGGDLAMAPGGKTEPGLRQAEVQLFWQESIHGLLADVKAWGCAIHGHFVVFPNGLQGMSEQIATRFRDCDLAMHEHSGGELGGNPGLLRRHVIAGIGTREVNDHLYEYKVAAGTGAACRANVLAYSGYPKADPANRGANPAVAALGIAEAAAFGGGGCYAPIDFHPWYPALCATHNRFFAANTALYAGKLPYGQVGILGFVWPGFMGERGATTGTRAALREVLGRHLLADVIPERVFTPAWIARYPVLIVPGIAVLSDAQLQALIDYARQGGRLVLLGETAGRRGAFGRARSAEAVAALEQAASRRCGGDLRDAWAPGGPLAGLELCPAAAAPLVRFAAYTDALERPTEVIVHAVNYDVDLGVARGRVGVVSPLEIAVPLPAGMRAGTAVLSSPEAGAVPLAAATVAGRARLSLPRLGVYGVVRITLVPEAKP